MVGSKGRKQLFKALSGQESPPEVPTVPLVLATFASKPLMMNGDSGGRYDFSVVNDCVTRLLRKKFLFKSIVMPHLVYSTLCSQCFWLDKQNMQIRETPYYTWYHDGSLTKHTDSKTTGLMKTGQRCDYVELIIMPV